MASVRSGGKCGYESGDLVTVRDEGGWHDNCGKEQYKLAHCAIGLAENQSCSSTRLHHTVQVSTDDESTKLLQDKCGNEQYISTEM